MSRVRGGRFALARDRRCDRVRLTLRGPFDWAGALRVTTELFQSLHRVAVSGFHDGLQSLEVRDFEFAHRRTDQKICLRARLPQLHIAAQRRGAMQDLEDARQREVGCKWVEL